MRFGYEGDERWEGTPAGVIEWQPFCRCRLGVTRTEGIAEYRGVVL